MQARLQEVVERGQPAQAAKAALLLERLASDPDDAQAAADAQALVDAYLHDPHLTRCTSR